MAVFSWGREVQTDVVMKMRMHVKAKAAEEEAMGDTAADLDRGNNEKPVHGKGYLNMSRRETRTAWHFCS